MPFEPEFEDVDRLDGPDRAEALGRVATDPPVELRDLVVGEPGVGLRERHERAVLPDGERVVGEAGSLRRPLPGCA